MTITATQRILLMMDKVRNLVYSLVVALILTLLSTQIQSLVNWGDSLWNKTTSSEPAYYEVESVADGDTIRVWMNGQSTIVRLVGIDTPETNHPSEPVQCFGSAATTFLKEMLDGQDVRLVADPSSTNTDRYDRLLRYVYLRDGTDVNAEIVRQGYGFAYVGFPLSRLEEFRGYESVARLDGRGLWSSCEPEFDEDHYESNPEVSVDYTQSQQMALEAL